MSAKPALSKSAGRRSAEVAPSIEGKDRRFEVISAVPLVLSTLGGGIAHGRWWVYVRSPFLSQLPVSRESARAQTATGLHANRTPQFRNIISQAGNQNGNPASNGG
jgi:hypothetical protein